MNSDIFAHDVDDWIAGAVADFVFQQVEEAVFTEDHLPVVVEPQPPVQERVAT